MRKTLLDINGTTLEVAEAGAGRPILFLHGIEKLAADPPLLELLAPHAHVIAPSHPGFGGSPLPDWMTGIDDLSYLYLDLIDRLGLSDIVLVGCSMGGWIAAEMAVKGLPLSHLVLVSPLGVKVGDRETRDFPDIYAIRPDEATRLLWHNPALAPDWDTLSDEAAEALLRHQEAAALFLWEPYMHNPKLPRRLHRVRVPTLVLRGAHDGLVSQANADSLCAAIPGAQFASLPDAAHVPEYEQPERLADHIRRFARL